MGIPCRHIIQRYIFDNQPLDPAEFYTHWRYNKGIDLLSPLNDRYFIRDLTVLKSAVRQKISGNRRIPFTHERRNMEIEQRARNAQATAQAAPEAAVRDKDIQRGRDKGVRRRGGNNKIQEVPGGAYI